MRYCSVLAVLGCSPASSSRSRCVLPTPAAHAGTRDRPGQRGRTTSPIADIDMKSLTVTYKTQGRRGEAPLQGPAARRSGCGCSCSSSTSPTRTPSRRRTATSSSCGSTRRGRSSGSTGCSAPTTRIDGYHAEKCRGIKMKPDFEKDVDHLQAAEPVRALSSRAAATSSATRRPASSSRAHWDEGSPADTTGDWFDTTYDLRRRAVGECRPARTGSGQT